MLPINKSHTTPEFEEKFLALLPQLKKIATRKIILFENNPIHSSLNTHKLSGWLQGFWSFYINRSYCVLFRFIKNNEVIYYDIDTHNIYK